MKKIVRNEGKRKPISKQIKILKRCKSCLSNNNKNVEKKSSKYEGNYTK